MKSKYNEEKQTSKSLMHLKSRILSKKLAWKQKLADFNEVFEKFSEKHKNSLHTKEQAVHFSESATKNLIKFKGTSTTDSENNRIRIESKLKIKKILEDSSKLMLENISRIDEEKKVKKNKIFSVFEKISENFSEVSRLKSEFKPEKKRKKVYKGLNLLRNLGQWVFSGPSVGIVETVDKVLGEYGKLVMDYQELSARFQNVSEVVYERKENCNMLEKEIEAIRNMDDERLREISPGYKHFSLSNQAEHLLLNLYAAISTFADEVFNKLKSVYNQTKDPQLYLYVQSEGKNLHSPISRSNTLDQFAPVRRKVKILTLNQKTINKDLPGLKNPSPQNEQTSLLKLYFKHFKNSENTQTTLLNNKIIRMFLHTEKKDEIERHDFISQKELARFLYCKGQETLQRNLKNLVNKILPLVLYVKSCVPLSFKAKLDEDYLKGRKKIVKGIESRFLVKSYRQVSRRPYKSPRGSLTIRRRKVPSESQSPEMFANTKVESLKAFREIDKKLRSIKLKFNF